MGVRDGGDARGVKFGILLFGPEHVFGEHGIRIVEYAPEVFVGKPLGDAVSEAACGDGFAVVLIIFEALEIALRDHAFRQVFTKSETAPNLGDEK